MEVLDPRLEIGEIEVRWVLEDEVEMRLTLTFLSLPSRRHFLLSRHRKCTFNIEPES